MICRLLMLVSLLSLALGLATAVLWVRSYRQMDRILWHDARPPLYAMLYSQDGAIGIRRGVIYNPKTGNVYCIYPATNVLSPFASLSYQPAIPHVVVVLLSAALPLAWLGRWFAPAAWLARLVLVHAVACYLCVWPVGICFARAMSAYPGAASRSLTEFLLAPVSVPWMLGIILGTSFGLVDPPPIGLGPPQSAITPMLVALLSYFLSFIATWIIAARIRRQRGRMPDSCAGCGYNLTGNVSGVCPECGTALAA